MKGILIFLVLFSLTLKTFAQEGFKVIRKAEHKYENGQNERVVKSLPKAEDLDYGFCVNAWMEANRCLDLFRAKKGFKVIRKAERKNENGQNERALKLLSKAENMNIGFCYSISIDANRAINLIRAKIYIDKKEYQMARNSLDSICLEYFDDWKYLRDNLDSIRIRTYQMEYGKDSLSSMIDSSLVNTKVKCEYYSCIAIIPLKNGKEIKMRFNQINFDLMFMDDEKQKVEIWVDRFKKSENYKLIKENS